MLNAFQEAITRLASFDPTLWSAIGVSIWVSSVALAIATPIGVAVGFALALAKFPGKRIVVVVLQSLLAFPTVVVGLVLYMLLTRGGLLGDFDLLFTRSAMIAGQIIIAFPIVAAFTLASVRGADERILETALTLGATPFRAALTTLFEVRFQVVAGVVNALGRIISEVGCAMMIGGNIAGETRTMPTAIALETSRGEFVQGIALGIVLLLIALLINIGFAVLQGRGRKV
jgi:tungstate transport system permease protein